MNDKILNSLLADLENSEYRSIIEQDAGGVIPKHLRQLDSRINRGEFTLSDVARDFVSTRNEIRSQFGNEVLLFRADAPVSERVPNAKTVYFGDRALVSRFTSPDRTMRTYKVPVNSITGGFATESGYYELIVKIPSGGIETWIM